MVLRSAGFDSAGVVGQFINVAPHLLMMGIDLQMPQLAGDAVSVSALDWWADMAEVELQGPRLHSPLQEPSAATPLGVQMHVGDDLTSAGNLQLPVGEEPADDLLARGNQLPQDNIVRMALEAEVCLPLPTPILRTRPRVRRARTPVSVHSLRRNGRIAARPRAPNATRQAQNLLLKKLGSPVNEGAPDAEVEERFRKAFQGGMTSRKQRCLQMLLHDGLNLPAMNLDMADLGDGMA
jgi:hypothetical protein